MVTMDDSATGPAAADSARRHDIRRAAAAEAGKHTVLIRTQRSGRILSAMMMPWFRLRPPRGYGVLTTTGRSTGKPRAKCVRVFRHDNRAYLVQLVPPHLAVDRPAAASGWLLNLRADPRCRLRLPDGVFDGTARDITDPTERVIARTILCEPVTPTDYGECAVHRRGLPSRTKIQALHRYWFDTGNPIVIELHP